jgi:transcriptional regulator with AbiEi antitoxin domain of type IV toxin-antitoxin system
MVKLSEAEKSITLELRGQAALLDCLRLVPSLLAEPEPIPGGTAGPHPDVRIRVEWPDSRNPPRLIVAAVSSSGEPRLARRAVHDLFWYTTRVAPESYGVFIAPYISPYAASICEREGYGYLDFAGNCHLAFDQVYLHREGVPNPTPERRKLRSLYSPKSERMLRVLLCHPGRVWRLQDLAQEAEVSLGYTHRIKEQLLDREWLSEGREGLRLVQPERMLTAWAENYDFRRTRKHSYYSLLEVNGVEAAIAECGAQEGLRYAFTGFSGAARVAPYVRYQRVHAYISPGDRERFIQTAELKPVSSGPNVILLEPYDEGVYYEIQDLNGDRVVSPVQLYLDLRMLPGRGEDAAEFLLDMVLRKQW